MSSRGQGRGVLRPPPTDCVPSKFPDPGGVEPFVPARDQTFLARHFRGFGPRLTLLACEERFLLGQQNPGGEQRAHSTKHRAESTDQMLFILAPDF
jgi:hypothetical protein